MDRTSCLERIALALLLTLSLSAAAPDPRTAYQHAISLCDRGDWNAALAAVDQALARFGNSDADDVWALRELRGYALFGRGRYDEALAAATPEVPQRLQHGEIEIRRLRVLAMASYYLRKRDDATAYLDRAQQIAEKQPKLLGDVLLVRANFLRSSNPQRSESLAKQALRLAQKHRDRKLEANALATLAVIRIGQERFDEAIDISHRALPLARQLNLDVLTARIEANAGWAYNSLGDPVMAEEVLTDANAIAARLGSVNDQLTCQLQLGNARLVLFDYAGAAKYYRSALDLARAIHSPRLGAALANVARSSLGQGDLAAARKFNDEALAVKRAANDKEGELRSLILEARIDSAAGDDAGAEALLQRVIPQAKSDKWEAQGRLAQLYVKTKRPALAEQQFRAAIEGASDLRDDVTSEELRFSLANTMLEFSDGLVDLLVTGGRAGEALEVAEQSRARTLAEGLGVATDRPATEPQRIARESGATILAYWFGFSRSYLWVVTPQTLEVKILPPAQKLDEAIDAYQKELLGPRGSLAASGARGQQLYRLLVEPAGLHQPAGARVAIVPDGHLSTFNMETLVVPSPQPHYWIEDATIETASALQFLSPPRAGSKLSMLLIGNPPNTDPQFPALPRAGAEIARVRRHFANSRLLEGPRATPRAYEESSPGQYDLVHFVAHGVANQQRPLDSAVVLGSDGEGYKLYARDVIKLPLKARLVTISSCKGAGNRTYAGEGLVGLAWAFLRAGAHEVIAALWDVSDNATPELMDSMYAAISAGRDPATALRQAKLSLLHSNGVYRRPLYWAPFVLYSGS